MSKEKIIGLTEEEQPKVRARIVDKGLSVSGWAKSRGFSVDTVKNALYRHWGRGEVGPETAKIIAKLREEGLCDQKTGSK